MLDVEIRLYSSDNVGGKYNTALSSSEDRAVNLAVKMFECEYFETLENCLSYIAETVGTKIYYDEDTYPENYMSEVFGRIFKKFRSNSEKYKRFLEHEVQYEYELDKRMSETPDVEWKYGEVKRKSHDEMDAKLLEKYYVKYVQN
jgi:hypothetical protein